MRLLNTTALLTVGAIAGSLLSATSGFGQGRPPVSGPSGSPLASLTSPNGQFAIDVTNNGITLSGAGTEVRLDAGGLTISGAQLRISSAGPVQIDSAADVSVAARGNARVVSGGAIQIAGSEVSIEAAARIDLDAPVIRQN